MRSLAVAAADVWNNCASVPLERHRCSFALVPAGLDGVTGRYAYVSLASELEVFDAYEPLDVTASSLPGIGRSEMYTRLLSGQIGVVLAGAHVEHAIDRPQSLPSEFVEQRDRLRLRDVTARQGIQQIGLDQLTSPRGAADDVYDTVAELWDTDLAIVIDVAMTLTAGADRQRYLDPDYHSQLAIGRQSALRQLANRSVQSNTLLAI